MAGAGSDCIFYINLGRELIIIKPLIMQRIGIAALLLLAIVSIVYGYNKDPKSVSAYEPDGNLKMDSIYQKDDSVFRYFRSTGQSKFLYRNRIALYDSTGLVSNRLRMVGFVCTPSTANGQLINISSAGFTNVMCAVATVETSSQDPNSLVIATIKSKTSTQVVVNLVQGNPALVNILGVTVNPFRFATNPASSKIHLLVVGY